MQKKQKTGDKAKPAARSRAKETLRGSSTAVQEPAEPRPQRSNRPIAPHIELKAWWGDGPPPWERFPGVTIKLEANWIPLEVKFKPAVGNDDAVWYDVASGAEIPAWMGENRGYWESPCGKYYFDRGAADKAVQFFPECLSHGKGEFAGKPFELHPWEEYLVVKPVFGWKHRETGLRRFRKVYIEIPKKNGKSQFCAGLGIYMLFVDDEPGAEIYCAAADREQAAIVFEEAKRMVEDCPDLFDRSTCYRRSIAYHDTGSVFKVLSSDASTKHGPNIHCLIFDELHVQADRELFETLEKGIAARRQPLIVMITTAGDDTESLCYEQHTYAESVIKEGGDDTFLPVLFNLTKEDNWQDVNTLRRVNPCLGLTVKEDYLQGEINAALKEPRKQNNFKRLHGNIWTQQHKLWIPIEKWDACAIAPEAWLEWLSRLDGKFPVASGLDLSSKTDLSGLVLGFKIPDDDYNAIMGISEPAPEVVLIPEQEIPGAFGPKPAKKLTLNFRVLLMPFFWMPEEGLTERKTKDRFSYDLMETKGLIELTPGSIIDYDAIHDKVLKLAKLYKLKGGEHAYDPWNATQLATQFEKDGFKMIEVPQTMNHLTEASKVFEALVLSGRILHSGHRVLRWNVENVSVKEDDAGNIKPVKPSKMKRIDGVIGSILAIHRLMTMKQASTTPLATWI